MIESRIFKEKKNQISPSQHDRLVVYKHSTVCIAKKFIKKTKKLSFNLLYNNVVNCNYNLNLHLNKFNLTVTVTVNLSVQPF